MPWKSHPFVKTILRFIFSILVLAAFTLALWIFRAYLSIQVIALLFMLPVLVSTRLWGLAPGILSALLAFLTFNYFFTVPYFTLMVHQTQDFLALIVFLIISVVVSQLLGQDQVSIASATAREREATRLYELSVALAGLMKDEDIAQILAEKICETFYAEKIAVDLHDGLEAVTFGCPPNQDLGSMNRKPDQVFPLATVRGQLGTVNVWRNAGKLSRAEERLLNTFTSQGALAIERARLIKTENRATVLEESDRLKTSLLNSVSHELRSPLATIKASISGLRSGMVEWDTEARQELMTAIEEETDHLNQLVGNLLDMSRIETGALNPQRKWNSLREIVEGVLKRMHQDVQNHHILVEIPPEIPLVPVDYIQMAQVFSNLISNSVKYAPPATEIFITARLQNDQMLLVQVSNEGPHVTEGDLGRIFDKFYRVTAAEKITGTGLGLSVCKGIIEAHGGKIWAENAPGRFIFNFTLPVTWEGMYPQIPEEA
jgi:two-component system, OmpR family, sensor histidine kinase KdpD